MYNPPMTTNEQRRIAELEQENRELRFKLHRADRAVKLAASAQNEVCAAIADKIFSDMTGEEFHKIASAPLVEIDLVTLAPIVPDVERWWNE